MIYPEPSVSVIIPAWNAQSTIKTAIDSALGHGDTPIEVIVVDDASDDQTAEVVESLGHDSVRLVRLEKNLGPGGARNAGINIAKGEWISVLDADDQILQGRYDRLLATTAAQTSDVLIDEILYGEAHDQQVSPYFGFTQSRELTLAELILSNRVFSGGPNLGYSKPLFRKTFLNEHKIRYADNLRIGEDFIFLADCLAAGSKTRLIPEPGYVYSRREGSLSHRLSLLNIEKMQDADLAFMKRWDLSLDEQKAIASHLSALDSAHAFTLSIEALKERDILRAIQTLISQPRAIWIYRYPVTSRLRRLFSRS